MSKREKERMKIDKLKEKKRVAEEKDDERKKKKVTWRLSVTVSEAKPWQCLSLEKENFQDPEYRRPRNLKKKNS